MKRKYDVVGISAASCQHQYLQLGLKNTLIEELCFQLNDILFATTFMDLDEVSFKELAIDLMEIGNQKRKEG